LPPEEVTEVPMAGRQIGDLTRIAQEINVHLPECTVAGDAECNCRKQVSDSE
jgi:hypothetical protein